MSDAVLRAFILGDVEGIRQALGLMVWENTPLAVHRGNVCDYCRLPIDGPGGGQPAGCVNNHEQWALRQRLIAELEARGRLRWDDLASADLDAFTQAWDRLEDLTVRLGIADEAWAVALERYRQRAKGPWVRVPLREEEPSDGRA